MDAWLRRKFPMLVAGNSSSRAIGGDTEYLGMPGSNLGQRYGETLLRTVARAISREAATGGAETAARAEGWLPPAEDAPGRQGGSRLLANTTLKS
jgi:hypothetical protein